MFDSPKPLVYQLYQCPMSGDDIERKSFEIIDREVGPGKFPAKKWEVIRRIIHTTADCEIAKDVCFSQNAIESGIKALKKASKIYVDSNMIRSGLSMARLKSVNQSYSSDAIYCHVADADVADAARSDGLPRSLHAMKKAFSMVEGSIVAIGNAPVALMELNRMIIEGAAKPALVIGAPVGFVHVTESKNELMSLPVDYITIRGRRGGSPLAVSIIHALCGLAAAAESL